VTLPASLQVVQALSEALLSCAAALPCVCCMRMGCAGMSAHVAPALALPLPWQQEEDASPRGEGEQEEEQALGLKQLERQRSRRPDIGPQRLARDACVGACALLRGRDDEEEEAMALCIRFGVCAGGGQVYEVAVVAWAEV
jgi:hypothetical protein